MANKKMKQPITKGIAKVPVVMQLEALECGAASLTMILAYYDKWIPLEEVRGACGVSRDGSNAKNILMAARNYGLTAKAYKYSIESLVKTGTFPCIIHWGFNHFVVLNGFKGNKAYLNDPAKGSITVSMDIFNQMFTGIVLTFEPSENFVPEGKKKSVYSFAKKRLNGAGTAIAFAIITTIISSIVNVIMPGFSRIFLDRLLTHQNPEWLKGFIIAYVIMAILQIVISAINIHYNLKISGKLSATGNATYMWKVLRLPMEFFSQRMSGDIVGRKSTNASITNTLVNTLAPLFLNSIMMVFYLVVMIRYSLPLTIIVLCAMLINLIVSNIISAARVNITRVLMRDQSKLANENLAGISMIETIKATGSEDGFFERWSGYQASTNAQNVRFLKIKNYLGMIPSIVNKITSIFVMFAGVFLTMQGQFTVGMILAFQGFMSQFSAPASTLISATQTIQEMRTQMERVEDVMEYPIDPVYDTKVAVDSYKKLTGNIEIKNITFGYSPLADPLIQDFSMSIKQGSKVAFVGSTGCGKSTIAKLISGLYQPWSGEITFDGKARSEINRSVFTGSIAVVDQDIIMFEDTISNNIKMWDDSIEDFEVILAARDAQIHDDIMRLDKGYQHKVLEGGKNFSGGQRQRIEIARALAQDPTVIIMDEATSALDAKTEYETIKAIQDRGITCIVIAHRLSTIRDCDEIVVLDHGKVVERGTHDELYQLGGTYTALVSNE